MSRDGPCAFSPSNKRRTHGPTPADAYVRTSRRDESAWIPGRGARLYVMRVQVPVYPPSSPFRFHLQLKSLLVPPCGAFSRRCLLPQQRGCCLSSSLFSPLCQPRVSLSRDCSSASPRGSLERLAQESCCARGIVVVVVVSRLVCVRSRRMRVKVYRGSPAAYTPPLLLYRYTFYIARDGQLVDRGDCASCLSDLLPLRVKMPGYRISISRLRFER